MPTSQNRQEDEDRHRARAAVVNLDQTKIKGLPDVLETLGRKYFLPVPHASNQVNDLEQKYFDLVEGLYIPGHNAPLYRALANFLGRYSTAIQTLHHGSSSGQVSSGKAKSQLLSGIIPFLEVQASRVAEESRAQRYNDDLPGTEEVRHMKPFFENLV